jgi:hypothetical protein
MGSDFTPDIVLKKLAAWDEIRYGCARGIEVLRSVTEER